MNNAVSVRENNITHMQHGRWVLPNIIVSMFGITTGALQKYRERGIMLEGVHYRRNPVNRIVYNVEAVNDWQEGKS